MKVAGLLWAVALLSYGLAWGGAGQGGVLPVILVLGALVISALGRAMAPGSAPGPALAAAVLAAVLVLAILSGLGLVRAGVPSGHGAAAGLLAGAILWDMPGRRRVIAGLALAALVGCAGLLSAGGVWHWLAGAGLGAAVAVSVFARLASQARGPRPGQGALSGPARRLSAWLRQGRDAVFRPPETALERRLVILLAGGFVLAFALFLPAPRLDLLTSARFHTPGEGFLLNTDPTLQAIRGLYETVIYTIPLATLALYLLSRRLSDRVAIPPALWGFAAGATLIGPAVIANLVFKENWGRARPSDIAAFGGEAAFTYPFQIAAECARNCSFPSGEGSGIAMTAFVIAILAWPLIRARPAPWLIGLAVLAAPGIAFRVMKGRHFLSDTVFAILIMGVVALVLYRLCDTGRVRERLTRRALAADLRLFAGYLTPGPPPTLWDDLLRLARAALDLCRTLLHLCWALFAPSAAAPDPG